MIQGNWKKLLFVPLLSCIALLAGCNAEGAARDAMAAAHGYVVSAQATWGDSCRANNTQFKCTSTNRLIDAEHVTALALLVYCDGPAAPGELRYAGGGVCVPVKGAEASLLSAVRNMNAIADQVAALLKAGN